MPPIRKITKEDIIKIALKIAKNESLDSINARRIAKELNTSVQPIFYNFQNMEDLKNIVFQEIYKMYQNYMLKGSKEEKSYRGMGLAYIKFAKDYPNYFKIIFMSKTNLTATNIIDNDNKENNVLQESAKFTGFDFETGKDFHLKVWIFTHGLASLVATKSIKITDKEIERLLTETVNNILIGIKKGNL